MTSLPDEPKKLSNGKKVLILQFLLCFNIIAVVAASYHFGVRQKELLSTESILVQRMNNVAMLTADIKNVQLDVIQVQQFLTDISATRGLDGLDDGFRLAELHAQSFESRSIAVVASANDLNFPDVALAMNDVNSKFDSFYAAGKLMAEAYVKDGPASGNKMMTEFDAAATDISDAVNALVQKGLDVSVQAADEALKLHDDSASFQTLLAVLGVVAMTIGVAAVAFTFVLDRQTLAQQKLTAELQAQQELERVTRENSSSFIIEKLGEGLEKLASGDLTFRLVQPFPDGVEKLRSYFNSTAEKLCQIFQSVKDGSATINRGTSEIAVASDDLSRRTESQAASLEETAAAVSQITSAVKQTAAGSEQAKLLALTARDEAQTGNDVVHKAVAAMQGIEASSEKITQIITVIDEIAFQTNLLALNAGVEAARAGEAGRGFAVVASEVRSLSDRSANAASDIKQLLEASNNQIHDGVTLVVETGRLVTSISARIVEIAKVVDQMNASTQQQASGLVEVNAAVEQMDMVTQQNAAMVEQATAATRSLSDQTNELAKLIAAFKTAEMKLAA